MRFRHADGSVVHLAYCTNVHPAEDLDGVLGQLRRFAGPIRERLGADRLGLGLWLSRPVCDALIEGPGHVARLREALREEGLEVVTFNGFPYQGFHGDPAGASKLRVYHPDWTTPDRLRYTLDLARVLAGLLPGDVAAGSISTLPLAWRDPWTPERAETAAAALDELAAGLAQVAADTGRLIRVGFEPEPGCVVETTAQAAEHLGRADHDHLGVCLDACHLAVQFEDPREALRRLAGAGLPVVKLQASCALRVDDPADPAARAALAEFDEPRFLHQTRERGRPGGTDDLGEALDGGLPAAAPWAVHFHVPLHARPAPPLDSTQDVLDATLRELLGGPAALTRHVEVETYTWQALPADRRPRTDEELAGGIALELAWIRDRLLDLGLKEEAT
ncbi:metabolite traffic protein EboE [Sphaerisporangium sp. TRM90804]|uniref:metabolite traffic protein EboE n=1 Tax=Sphaerisporangium sp. TRM90804 TaxID=3031113 RepID=UPI002447F2FF|nr:metabolite traffic protein EboE [Sphaerisporangium sp. TRM90804]MDH2426316.1 metabolite traffic protein EboE [Sphaerisporangium sp. TRM90804]